MRKLTAFSLLVSALVMLPASFSAAEERAATRIVCWGKGHSLVTDALYMFPEAADAVIAMGESSQAGGSFIEYLDPGYSQKAVLSMEIQPETAASFNPTHIILKGYMKKAGANLERLGFPVVYVDMESPEQYETEIMTMGRIFGNTARAEELVSFFKNERSAVESLTGTLPDSRKPSALFVYYSIKGGAYSLKVPPAAWLQSRLFNWAGARPVWTDNPAGDNWQTVSFEQIAAWDPDYVFLVSYHDDVNKVHSELAGDPLWKQLRAVKDGNFLAFPGDFLSWDQPSPRWILGLTWAANALHPDLVSKADVDRAVYRFYAAVYGMNREAVDKAIFSRISTAAGR